jgi:YesN/AraC family two-component response regulator
MDIKMPDLDGIQAAAILTEERIAPCLLLSAFSQQELIQRAKQAGVFGYLVKPFRESELAPAIEVALARFAEFRQLEKEAADLRDTLETRKLVERAKGGRGVPQDPEAVDEHAQVHARDRRGDPARPPDRGLSRPYAPATRPPSGILTLNSRASSTPSASTITTAK